VTDPLTVLKLLADSPVVMGFLDSGPCRVLHVAVRNPEGPDARLDPCPCARSTVGADLGEGQYLASGDHSLADVVRDVIGKVAD
jgi:hypothetical protein